MSLPSLQLKRPLRDVVLGTQRNDLAARLAAVEQAGYERGRAHGEAALSEQLMQQRADLLALQKNVFDALEGTMPRVRQECERALVQLAMEVARKLVCGLPVSGAMVEAAVREALGQVDEHTDLHIYLQPEDLELLQQINSPVLLPTAAGHKVHFHRGPELSRGSCLVRTRFGFIDAQRETKFQLLQRALLS
jgi:flagellar assembly protein FliH